MPEPTMFGEEQSNCPSPSHQDEFPAEYSLVGCSPAEPTSALSAMLIVNQKPPVGNRFSANGNRPQFHLSHLVTQSSITGVGWGGLHPLIRY
jgi:hypothetical protein